MKENLAFFGISQYNKLIDFNYFNKGFCVCI